MAQIGMEGGAQAIGAAGGASVPLGQTMMFQERVLAFFMPQLVVNGGSSVAQTLTLPRNAVVLPPFEVTVRTGRAQWTRCGDVGQVRVSDISFTSKTSTQS